LKGQIAGRVWLASLLLGVVAWPACGRKGPPLPPLVRVPAAVGDLAARRVGADVYLTFTVPAENVDGSRPPDVRRVDLYALTAADPPSHAAFLRAATRVATVPVAAAEVAGAGSDTPDPAAGAAPGAPVTVLDASGTGTAAPPEISAGQPRYYLAVPVGDRERSNPSGRLVAVPAAGAPAAPGPLSLTYTADRLTVAWPVVPGASAYNVYRADASEAPAPHPLAWTVAPPAPLNDRPLVTPEFSEPVAFGRERCYRVRVVRADAGATFEGEASPPGCLTPEDVFAPAAPQGLQAVAGPDGISLRWLPNREPDLGGYLVLRGTAGDATLLPMTGSPVTETQYLDRDVVPGVRYVYAVVAVDSRRPTPNPSPESPRDEVTAR